jgi:hypothetical protein
VHKALFGGKSKLKAGYWLPVARSRVIATKFKAHYLSWALNKN